MNDELDDLNVDFGSLDLLDEQSVESGPGVIDLGEVQQAILLFGGCYSNLQATQALRNWAERHGFAPEHCICTGDMVAYAANPVETIAVIRDWGVQTLQGNVEQSLANDAQDCGCGFEQGSSCDVLSKGWYPFAVQAMQESDREWFRNMATSIRFSMAGKQCQAVHGAFSDISRFMFASTPEVDFLAEFALTDAEIVLGGHCGIPFTRHIGQDRLWHNSGAVGMPANDGQVNTWFSVISPKGDGQIEMQHHRLDYDVQGAFEAMQEASLTQGYHDALLTGLWPSMDVLPDAERQQQGQAIDLS